MSGHASSAEGTGLPVGELVFAGGVAGLGIFTLVRAGSIVEPIAGGALGPRTLPYIVGTVLVLCGLATLGQLLRGHRGEAEQSEDLDPNASTHWVTVGILVGLFVLHAFLIQPLGWPLAAAVLFAGAAWTLGATSPVRAALGGLVLAFVVQIAFAGGLGVSLPAGPLFEGVSILGG